MVWCSPVTWRSTHSTCGVKPSSAMRSASSRMATEILSRLTSSAFMRSMRRNGVATMSSTPFSSSSICLSREAPPYTASTFMPQALAMGSRTSATCNASSRVGTSTRPCGKRGAAFFAMRESAGTPKARVFPLPVRARPHTSWPFMATGMASVWMANGAAKPAAARPASISAGTPRAAKAVGVETGVDMFLQGTCRMQ